MVFDFLETVLKNLKPVWQRGWTTKKSSSSKHRWWVFWFYFPPKKDLKIWPSWWRLKCFFFLKVEGNAIINILVLLCTTGSAQVFYVRQCTKSSSLIFPPNAIVPPEGYGNWPMLKSTKTNVFENLPQMRLEELPVDEESPEMEVKRGIGL